MSADGVRIALLVKKDGKTSLKIGRVERTGAKGEQPEISVADCARRPRRWRRSPPCRGRAAAGWWWSAASPVACSRCGTSRATARCPPRATLPGLTGVKEIAASEDEQQPLVARLGRRDRPAADGRALADAWSKEGSAPVYPG